MMSAVVYDVGYNTKMINYLMDCQGTLLTRRFCGINCMMSLFGHLSVFLKAITGRQFISKKRRIKHLHCQYNKLFKFIFYQPLTRKSAT